MTGGPRTHAAISVQLLGKGRVMLPGQAARDLPRKGAALLAVIAVDGATPRARLAAWLWPDAIGDKPRANLRGLLRDLRDLTGCELARGAESLELAAGVEHDLGALGADRGAQPPLGVPLAAYDYGDLDEFSDWLSRLRERWMLCTRRQLRERIAQLEAADPGEAITLAERLVGEDLHDEGAVRLLMRLHYQHGDTASALRVFARCEATLSTALGNTPDPATRALATLIESREPLPGARTHPAASQGLQPTHLVAREVECGAVFGGWRQGRTVLLLGEAGIGKSRLLQHVASLCPAAVTSGAAEGDWVSPYATLSRLLMALREFARPTLATEVASELARLRPEFGAPAKVPASTHRLTEALALALRSWRAAGVEALLVDDLHHADAASVKVLLGAIVAGAGVDWLLATRTAAAVPGLETALTAQADRWHELPLRPLRAAGIEALLRAMPDAPDAKAWAEPLAAQAKGNPLLVIECLRALAVAGPLWRREPPDPDDWPRIASLEALLPQRVARLERLPLHLAQLAAIAGPLFGPRLATEVLDAPPLDVAAAWTQLKLEGVLAEETLTHDCLRTPLEAMLPAAMLRELHGRVAAAAASLGAAPALLAEHYWLARTFCPAARQYEIAATQAFELGARSDELRLWDRAAECHERTGDLAGAFAAHCRACDTALAVLPLPDAAARAQALESAASTPSETLDAKLALARAAATAYRYDDAAAHARAALDFAIELADPVAASRRTRASLLLASALAGSGQHAQALERLMHERDAVAREADPRLQMDYFGTLGYVLAWAARFREAAETFERALGIAETLDDAAEAATFASNLATILSRRGDGEGAVHAARSSATWRRRSGDAGSAAGLIAEQVLATLLSRLARFAEALDLAEAALERARSTGHARLAATCESTLARIWLDLGRSDRARATLTPWPDHAQGGGASVRTAIEAQIDAAEGLDPLPRLDRARELAASEPAVNRWAVELQYAPLTEPRTAVAICRAVAEAAAAAGALSFEQAAWLREADAWRRSGDARAALPRLQGALQRLSSCLPAGLYIGEVWCIAARVFDAAQLQDEARLARREGCNWLRRTALPNVPEPHRDSFIEGNRFNRELLESLP